MASIAGRIARIEKRVGTAGISAHAADRRLDAAMSLLTDDELMTAASAPDQDTMMQLLTVAFRAHGILDEEGNDLGRDLDQAQAPGEVR